MKALVVIKDNIDRKKVKPSFLLKLLDKKGIKYETLAFNDVEKFYEDIHKKSFKNSFDILISFGGDGTILKSARVARKLDIPILGINAGTVGFLTVVNYGNDIELALDKVKAKKYSLAERSMLDVKVYRGNKKVFNSYAVNEATITTINISKISHYVLYVGKDKSVFTSLSADGVIIATPTGSTAHSFSAGGPIVTYDVNCFIITPICPFTLNQRSYVVNSKKNVHVDILNDGQFVDIDGRINFDLLIGDKVEVSELKRKVKYIVFESDSFFTNIRNKIKAL